MISKHFRFAFALLFCIAIGFNSARGQTTVTFRVNISDLTKEQSFDPERDRVELIGNRYPLSATQPIILKQNDNNADLFTTQVDFPANMFRARQSVEYQFRVRLNHSYYNEDIPRTLRVPEDDTILDAIYFNSYAW